MSRRRSSTGNSSIKATLLPFLAACFFISGTGGDLRAQTKVLIDDEAFSNDARMAIDSLYNRNPEGARNLLEPWRARHPSHPIWLLWEGMELWWEVLYDLNDLSRDEEFAEQMQRADYEAGKLIRQEPDHPDALIIRAVATGYIARLQANREEWVASLQIGRKGYQAYQRLLEVRPGLPDNAFAEGMKLYYSAYIPEAYPVVRAVSWFLPEGDRQEGLQTLQTAAEKGVFARPEAIYFLGTILLNYERDYSGAKTYFKKLVELYPDNSYYRRLYLRTLDQLNEYREIIVFSGETRRYWNENNLPPEPLMDAEFRFWVGKAQYNTGRIAQSFDSFATSVEEGQALVNSGEREFVTLAAFFAGRAAERLHNREEAKKYYTIAASQTAVPDAREEAGKRLRALSS